ncbi:MAG TPA: alpha-glucosidase [Oscillospiraceae bacterium]|nr:alpha-glucosidase [Oscillospiraceae bacterium]
MAKAFYKDLIVYQIWPRSFYDSNGDGIGDIGGIISKLDYIKSLGANAIWLSPIYPSPNHDYGYDIADYMDISPDYGTLDDFKMLLFEAHSRDIKIIMDLVINHTSNEHKWFIESKKSEDNPYHDYYFWRKGKSDKKPPNNWKSTFAGPGWTYDERLDKWYLHLFAVEQPDLNMDNPKVREEVKKIMRFWLDMGVDGFREDVITFISKKEGLPDGFPIPVACGIEHYKKGPHLHEYLAEFKRDVLSHYECFTVGEAPMMTTDFALELVAEGKDQKLDMMFHFEHMQADCFITDFLQRPFKLKRYKSAMSRWQKALYGKAWNTLYLENHDHPRIISRYGNDKKYRVESGKMLAVSYLCQGGTPFIYQGQEIGMTNIGLSEIDMYEDVATKNVYKMARSFGLSDKIIMSFAKKASRDNARTPIQWNSSKNAGFTTAEKPWFHINPNYPEINVENDLENPNSILNFYKKLIKLRKDNPVFTYGSFKEHMENSKDFYVYERNYEGKKLFVICSFSDKNVRFKAPKGINLDYENLILANYNSPKTSDNEFTAKPYEARVYLFG